MVAETDLFQLQEVDRGLIFDIATVDRCPNMRLRLVALTACSHSASRPAPVPVAATENPCFANQPPIKATAMQGMAT